MEIPKRKKGHFNTKFLAARRFISPTQVPSVSAAREGLQDRKKYKTSSIYIVNKGRLLPLCGQNFEQPE